ncbi:DnaJ C-terminal domain-containing protein [Amycolatopsis roodepoortensis]|uniref:Curved DNA-binding protein n=1 Tax=Amycolatopsis roodepoortensis TaxID=700274 RepID=A0ABR9LB14_9PSEU|nr:DnaJ C-terminal domain-containing protein [Amycolatopsis roodepoortensis]MBE1577725.1 curved DNA-binding protein [Amycolatopsis roodepoortensis]
MAQDFYTVLGVSRTADQAEIQRAYRKLARQYHPDINKDPGAEDRFKEISEAYDVLSEPETRRRYDAFGPDFRQVPDGMDPETWARARSGAPGGGPYASGNPFGSAEDIDLEDLLGGIFGGRARRHGPMPGADQEASIELTVEDAHRGGKRSITLGPRTIDVDIPAGVTDGQRIRLAGQGGRGTDGAPPGDLYLIVHLAPHRRYRVDGRDLTVDLPLSPWEAALGTTVTLEIPGGEAKLKVPPGTSTGRRLRLRGRGLPHPRGAAGDLYAKACVVVPSELTDEEREQFERLAAVSAFDPRSSDRR